MRNFQGEDTQPMARLSLGEQPMRGMDQVVTNRLPFSKKDTTSCEHDKARQAAMKACREALKQAKEKSWRVL